jgi:hypothetical protein
MSSPENPISGMELLKLTQLQWQVKFKVDSALCRCGKSGDSWAPRAQKDLRQQKNFADSYNIKKL